MGKAAQCPSYNCLCVGHRYFLHNWPQLAFLAYDGDHCFGTVVCKMDVHREQMLRGYLAMLVVEKPYRSLGTGVNCLLMSLSKCLQLQGIYACAVKGMTCMMTPRNLNCPVAITWLVSMA